MRMCLLCFPEKSALSDVVESFNRMLQKHREDVQVCNAKIRDLNEEMVAAIEDDEDISEITRRLVQQATIAAEHRKCIKKIEQNETKHAVKHCSQRVTYVIQRYVEEGDHTSANLGLADATKRLKAYGNGNSWCSIQAPDATLIDVWR
jgi:methyl-accepting chemotaxis protein